MKSIQAISTPVLSIFAFGALLCSLFILASCAGIPDRDREKAVIETEKDTPYEEMSSLLAAGKPDEALQAFEKAYEQDPDSLETALLRSNLLVSLGRTQEAKEGIERYLEKHSENPDLLFTRALIAGLEGSEGDEKSLLEQAVAQDPKHGRAQAALGELYMQDRDYEKAEEAFKQSIETEPDNIVARAGYGNLLLRQQKYEASVQQLDEAVEAFPEYPFAWADRGKAKAGLGKSEEAISDLSTALKLDPHYYWHYIDRGRLYLFDGYLDKAEEDFLKAQELDPDYFLSYVYLAGIERDREEFSQALSYYESCLERRPDYFHAFEPAANCAFLSGAYERAALFFGKAYEQFPEAHHYCLMEGISLLEAGKTEAAEDHFRHASSILPKEGYFYDIARSFTDPGYDSYLVSQLGMERELPLKMRSYFYLGLLYRQKGNRVLAQRYLSEVQEAALFGMYETEMADTILEQEGADE